MTTLTKIATPGEKFDLVTTGSVGARKVVGFTTEHPVAITVVVRSARDAHDEIMGRDIDVSIDVELYETPEGVVFSNPHDHGVIVPGAIEDLAAIWHPMLEDVDNYIVSSLRGVAPAEERPPWEEVYKWLERKGAVALVGRLKAHYGHQ